MIHIAFGDSAAGCLRTAIKLGMPGDQVVVSRDDYTQGPISDCIVDGGLAQRSKYWSSLRTLQSKLNNVYEHYLSSINRINNMDTHSKVIIWLGDSAHDLLATSWLLSYLNHSEIDLHYIDLKNVESPNDNNMVNAAMLSPEQILEAYNISKPFSMEYQQKLKHLWSKIAFENKAYRVKNGEDIISMEEDCHDAFILSFLNKKDQYLGKVLGNIMSQSEHRLTDLTIESRLVFLQIQKKIKIEFNLARIFLSKVRLK